MTKRLSHLRIRLDHMGKIARDESGNIMWITALALFPLIGIVGSGVDISRYYTAQTRLQQACDAGVMAARKQMITTTNAYTNSLNSSIETAGDNMFNFNYPDGVYGNSAKSFTVSVPAGTPQNTTPQRLVGTATSTVPPIIMGMFSFTPQNLSITCGAQLEISNVDAVLVLDVTGSMACPSDYNTSQCSSYLNGKANADGGFTETTYSQGSRLEALRGAVMSFYDNVAGAQSADTRIRLSVVPYSSHVNIGNFTKAGQSITGTSTPQYMPSSYFADSWNYYFPTSATTTSATSVTKTGLRSYISNRSSTQNGKIWSGCAEEVATQAVNDPKTASSATRALMYDLNVNYIPTGITGAGLFKPSIENQDTTDRYGRTQPPEIQVHCPNKEAFELTRFTTNSSDRTALLNYVKDLRPRGGTYHDIGMIWGTRLLAPGGMFASLNNAAPGNGLPVGKHIIFMTDGELQASPWSKSAYGVDTFDRRIVNTGYNTISGSGYATQSNRDLETNRHRNRFNYLCERAKASDGGNATVWVVSFGVDVSNTSNPDVASLRNCATTVNHVYSADNSAQLNSVFAQIASRISKLRLSQ